MNLNHLTPLIFLFGATVSCAAPPAPLNNTPESIVSLVKENYEGFAHNRAEHWLEVVTEVSGATEIDKVMAMQKHFNQYPYVDDAVHWGKTDYWASLPELIGVKGGDCEDVAIAKYHSLRLLGVPHDKMRLLVVAQKDKKSSHMVLIYRSPEGVFFLDNKDYLLGEYRSMPDYIPIYSFNEESMWVETGEVLSEEPTPVSRLGKALDVKSRILKKEMGQPIINVEFL